MVAAVMMIFSRINKHSFYHYYFEVIEEVESRNFQGVKAESFSLSAVAAVGQQVIENLVRFFSAFWPAILLLLLPAISLSFSPFQSTVWPQLTTKLYRKFAPALAP